MASICNTFYCSDNSWDLVFVGVTIFDERVIVFYWNYLFWILDLCYCSFFMHLSYELKKIKSKEERELERFNHNFKYDFLSVIEIVSSSRFLTKNWDLNHVSITVLDVCKSQLKTVIVNSFQPWFINMIKDREKQSRLDRLRNRD